MVAGPEARALRHVFFAEREARKVEGLGAAPLLGALDDPARPARELRELAGLGPAPDRTRR